MKIRSLPLTLFLVLLAGFLAGGCRSKAQEATSPASPGDIREESGVSEQNAGRPAWESPAGGEWENQPPEVSDVSLAFDPIEKGGGLRAAVQAGDPEGEKLEFEYIWTKNFREKIDFSGNPLPRSYFVRGDILQVEVIPIDSEGEGEGKKSERIGVPNYAPRITSMQEASAAGKGFSYQVSAEDADGDPLSFSLTRAPAGMEIDEKTGLISWGTPAGGSHEVEVTVKDSEGNLTSRQFTLSFEEEKEPKEEGAEKSE